MKIALITLMVISTLAFQNCSSSSFEAMVGPNNDISSLDQASSAVSSSSGQEEAHHQDTNEAAPSSSNQQNASNSSPGAQEEVAQEPVAASCAAFTEFNPQTGACESCSSKNLSYSKSEKRCVATCNGGFILRLRQTDATSMEKVMNPMGYNMISGFSFTHNSTRINIGDAGTAAGVAPTSQFFKDLNAVVSNQSAEQGVANAFHAAIQLAQPSLNGSVSLGESYTTYEKVKQQAVLTTNYEIVYSASGSFDVRSAGWRVFSTILPSSHAFMTKVYCK